MNNEGIPGKMRKVLLNIYGKNPDLARAMARERIVGVHGSTSGSLINVLTYGLKAQRWLDEHNILVASGDTHIQELIIIRNM